MMQIIDSHQHFWSIGMPGHQWPTPDEGPIHRDFGPADLVAEADGIGLAGTILVQSQPTDSDTDWMLALARDNPMIKGVVGWVDLADPDAPRRIAELAQHRELRGLRPMLQSIENTDWLLQDALRPALEAMQDHKLRFDALIQPRHLPMLARFVDRWPGLPVVIDHAAKPKAAAGLLDPWRTDIAALAARGVYCKLSGLRTEQASGQPAQDLLPYVAHLVASFGDRLMWGSDWPVLHLSGDDYRRWYQDADRLTGLRGAGRDRLFSGAARDFYGLDDDAVRRLGDRSEPTAQSSPDR